jgi:hypothetical protein
MATIEREITTGSVTLPITVTVEWQYDDWPDSSGLGEFTLDKPYEGAVRVELPPTITRHLKGASYWHPPRHAYFVNRDADGNRDIEDMMADYFHGTAHERWVKVRAMLKAQAHHLRAYLSDQWSYAGVIVRASYLGITGEDSLWGIEYGRHDEEERVHHADCVEQVTAEAILDLEGRLKRIADVVGAVA